MLCLGLMYFMSLYHITAQVIADFETATTTPSFSYGKNAQITSNPDNQGNTSDKVAYYLKEAGNWKFISLSFAQKVAIRKNNTMTFYLRSSTKGRVYVKLWNGESVVTENWSKAYSFMPEADKWTVCEYDLSNVSGQQFDRIEIAASVDNEAEAKVYLDNFRLFNTASPNGEPIVVVSTTSHKVNVNQAITFDASDSYDITSTLQSIAWDFKDGTKATGSRVSHTFQNEGVYSVEVTVTNALGLFSKKIIDIYVLPQNQKVSKPKWLNTTFRTNQKIEGNFVVLDTYQNPYNPEEVSIDAEITLPNNTKILVPCFYFIKSIFQNNQWKIDSTQQHWAVRFSSPQVGKHLISLKLTDKNGISISTLYQVDIQQSTLMGIVGIDPQNKQYYRHQTGEPYYPLGINVAWDSQVNYGTIMNNLADANANLVRYWQVPFNRQALEWKNDNYTLGLGMYSQQAAAMQDSILNLAEKRQLKLQLTLFQHGMFSENVNSNWADNPYNAALGGPLGRAEEFFYNATAKKGVKKLLRYIVARWGYSPNVFAWELFNEVQFTGMHPNQSAAWRTGVLAWHDEMGQYLKSIDPFKHIVTTSADDNQCLDMDKLQGLDVVQYHLYNTKLLTAQNALDKSFKEKLTRTAIINGEYGLDVTTADVPFDMQRIIIWTGIMSQVPHLMWLWDNYKQADWANLFQYPAAFLKDRDFVKEGTLTNWNPTASYTSTLLDALGFKSDKNAYVLVYDTQNRNNLSNANLLLTDLPEGKYKAKFVNTATGEVSQTDITNAISTGKALKLPDFSKALAIQLTYEGALVTATEDEIGTLGQLKLYPNPCNNDITVEFASGNSTKVEMTLHNMLGMSVHHEVWQVPSNRVQQKLIKFKEMALPFGLYFLKMTNGKQEWNEKIMYLNN